METINAVLKCMEGHTVFDMCCNQIEHCLVLWFKLILQFEYKSSPLDGNWGTMGGGMRSRICSCRV